MFPSVNADGGCVCYDNICLIIGCSLYRNPGLLLPLPLYPSHYLPFISPTLEIFLPHTKVYLQISPSHDSNNF